MSNTVVGTTYAAIIDKVIQASQNDFEEYGIDQRTLLAMKEAWQQKLSGFRTATFPWDPAPAQPMASNPPTLPSNVKGTDSPTPNQTTLGSNGNYPAAAAVKREPNVKTEPSPTTYTPYQAPPGLNVDIAQRRAQELIQQRQQSMNQGYAQQMPPGAGPNGAQQPGAYPPQQRINGLPQVPGQPAQQYRPPQAAQQHPNSLKSSQVDGGADELLESIMPGRQLVTDEQRLAADASFREQIEAQARITDSGLFVPMSQIKEANRKGGKAHARLVAANAASSSQPRVPQLDGDFDDDDKKYLGIKEEPEVDDEDAINSDLDDSEDELRDAEDTEDDNGGHAVDTMLCTYDKVQRVKNKWKATLKDGIICTGGRDYLFHKANGEFEW